MKKPVKLFRIFRNTSPSSVSSRNPILRDKISVKKNSSRSESVGPSRRGIDFTNILRANFSYKCFVLLFFNLQFGFVIFWCKNISAIAACKMLIKLTIGINFVIILLGPFSYTNVLSSFSLVTFWLCNFLAQEYQHKSCL